MATYWAAPNRPAAALKCGSIGSRIGQKGREQSSGMTGDGAGSRIIPAAARRETHQGVTVKLRNLLIDSRSGVGPAGPGVAGFQEI